MWPPWRKLDMCGRYVSKLQPLGRWKATFATWIEEHVDAYNIAPTAMVPVFTALGWSRMRWGLVPSWSREPRTRYATFNARAESLPEKPTYRSAWKHGQRCLLPAAGYYEWKKEGKNKDPFFIQASLDEPLVFAGIWDRWTDRETELLSCSIITCQARGELVQLHHRMPMMLAPEHADQWLHGSPETNAELLAAPPSIAVQYHRVDARVGNTRNQGADLIKPV